MIDIADKSPNICKCIAVMACIRAEYCHLKHVIGRSDWIVKRDGKTNNTTIVPSDDPTTILEDARASSSIHHIGSQMDKLAEVISPGAPDQVMLELTDTVEDHTPHLSLKIHTLPTNKHMTISCIVNDDQRIVLPSARMRDTTGGQQ